jgi:hypothetical protein
MRRSGPLLLALAVAASGLLIGPASAVDTAQTALVSTTPAAWTPNVLDGVVKTITQVGSEMVVGGTFTQVRPAGHSTVLARTDLFAFDAHTGVIDAAFVPSVDGEVDALAAADDHSVFVGGAFTHVNGAAQHGLAKLDLRTGRSVGGFDTAVTGPGVTTLVLRRGRLFVGGSFTAVGSTPRVALAAVDPTSGGVDPDLNFSFVTTRKGVAKVARLDVTPDGAALVAVGNFTQVAGQDRAQIVLVDLTAHPARVANWETDAFKAACTQSFDTDMRGVDIAPDGSYFVVVTTGAFHKGSLCDAVSRWELGPSGSALAPTWVDFDGGDSFTGVAVTGAAIYVGGHNRWMNNPFPHGTSLNAQPGRGAVAREGIAALDPSNGLPFSWNPGRTRGEGAWALVATADGLWVGSDTTSFDGQYHARIAFCPLAGGTAVATPVVAGLPGELYALGLDGNLTRRSFDATSAGPASTVAGAPDWSHARGAVLISGQLYTGGDNGVFSVRTFDGTTFGPPSPVDLHGLTAADFPVAKLTGLYFDHGRLYYTVSGDQRLFYRYFTPESGVVGTLSFVASGHGDGLNWQNVTGLTEADGWIYFASSTGKLSRVEFANGRPIPVTVTAVATSPTFASHGLFIAAS